VWINSSPGTGRSWRFVVRRNGADTPVACTVLGARRRNAAGLRNAWVERRGRTPLAVAGSGQRVV
jgi:hypothetical protein